MSGKLRIRTMREEPPPRGRYWNQKVLLPLDRILRPKPLTAASQRKAWPALGARARFTAASVRFFPMRFSDSVSTAFCTPNFVWRTTEQYGEICRKIKANGACSVFLYGAVWRHKGQDMPAMEGGYHVSMGQSVTKADRQGSLNHSAMSAHCPVSGHDRAIYDAGCSSGVTIGTRACTATMTLPRVSASSRLESWASRSCNPRQNSMRAATDGGVSIEPKLATCSWQILPFSRRFSTKLIASP